MWFQLSDWYESSNQHLKERAVAYRPKSMLNCPWFCSKTGLKPEQLLRVPIVGSKFFYCRSSQSCMGNFLSNIGWLLQVGGHQSERIVILVSVYDQVIRWLLRIFRIGTWSSNRKSKRYGLPVCVGMNPTVATQLKTLRRPQQLKDTLAYLWITCFNIRTTWNLNWGISSCQ